MNEYNIDVEHLFEDQNTSIVELFSDGIYWINQNEFCDNFRNVPLTNKIIIHDRSPGLSLTHSLLVPAVQKLIEESGRDSNTVYVFSANNVETDTAWKNLYWKHFRVSSWFTDSNKYWTESITLDQDVKTWGLCIKNKTTPRLLAFYDICSNTHLRQNCFLADLSGTTAELIFEQPDKIHDQLEDWIPIEDKLRKIQKYRDFKNFCQQLPTDFATETFALKNLIIDTSGRYLFEIIFETITHGFTFAPSEETVKTIVSEKPAIVFATKNFLKNMRDLGFETFGNLWDESYDQLEGQDRYCAMMKLINNIAVLPRAEQFELYQKSRDICKRNKKLLKAFVLSNDSRLRIQDNKVSSVRYAP